ncbi:MAG TPA: tail fiber domain-containing protein [Candidatus Deferrimicrobium sp.]|nr:tail fiber domain-containing protein [Candidatus Deferrimicrobium sp.]
MKKHSIINLIVVFVFFFVSFQMMAEVQKDMPIAVSPGSEQEVTAVSQNCPTFSWSAVDGAAAYRVAVFITDNANVMPYEEMALKTSSVVSKDIPGPALSCTLSSEESLKNGNMYAWYVQAIDAYGNGVSGWSKGRIFKVKQEAVWVGIEEKLGQKMKEYGISDDVIKNVLNDIDSEVKEVAVPTPGSNSSNINIGRIKGLEDTFNTFYGLNAGSNIINGNGTFETFIGANAGYSTTDGYDNTFIGYNSGYTNSTGGYNLFAGSLTGYFNTIGSYNTFLGPFSGYDNTTGTDNVFVGYDSGENNTTGRRNCIIGSLAGIFNTTGSCNTFLGSNAGYNNNANSGTFIGHFAGKNNSSGNYNSFLGNYSGYSNTTGYSNTFLGADSGYGNNTGYKNTFVGYSSGNYNSSGYSNSFFGYYSGVYNTTGNFNTYLGYGAGLRNSTGNNNIAIGNYTAYDNTDGSNNTYLGSLSGYYNHGTGNVFIGYSTGYNEAGSDKLYIDNSNTASPLIYGDFFNNILKINGNLGVGITPIHPLHMASGAHCTVGGVWTNASSRSLKENIRDLSTGEALETLDQLNPVRYNYKTDKTDECLGFIAEDVPELVATADRKSLSPMDVTAVLTKVVQELRKENEEYRKLIADLQERMAKLEKK